MKKIISDIKNFDTWDKSKKRKWRLELTESHRIEQEQIYNSKVKLLHL